MIDQTFFQLSGRIRRWFSGAAVLSLIVVPAAYGGSAQMSADGMVASAGWVDRPPLHVARGGLDVVTVDGQIIVMGGFDPEKPDVFASVEARRAAGTGTWHDLAPMPTARTNPAAAVLGGKVYVAGGVTNDGSNTDVVETYDPGTGRWSTGTRLPLPRSAGAAATLAGLLYVAGGGVTGPAGEQTSNSVVVFNPASRRWSSVAPMPTARWALRLVASDRHLYAIGGRSTAENSLPTVERFDPRTNTWTTVAPMVEARAVPGVVAVDRGSGHLIVVVGGCPVVDGEVGPFRRTTEVYDVATGRWRVLSAQLPRGRCSLGSALEADGSVLAISGGVKVNGVIAATAEVQALETVNSRRRRPSRSAAPTPAPPRQPAPTRRSPQSP